MPTKWRFNSGVFVSVAVPCDRWSSGEAVGFRRLVSFALLLLLQTTTISRGEKAAATLTANVKWLHLSATVLVSMLLIKQIRKIPIEFEVEYRTKELYFDFVTRLLLEVSKAVSFTQLLK